MFEAETRDAEFLREYEVDTRPLCQGMPFVLSDSAHPRLVLKQGSQFLVLDMETRIPACNALGFGYYRNDTRFLSQWDMTLDGAPLSLLSFDVSKGFAGSFLFTNPQTASVPQQRLMLQRRLVLNESLWEELTVENYDMQEVSCELCFEFRSDFADMFEVRGLNRSNRGQRMVPVFDFERKRLFLAYKGLDECLLETEILFHNCLPESIGDGKIAFNLSLPPRTAHRIQIEIRTTCNGEPKYKESLNFDSQLAEAEMGYDRWLENGTRISTRHEIVDFTVERGMRDLFILRQPTPKGMGLAAGIPWYCAIFGRDSAITGWQLLPFRPDISRECIEILSAYQGSSINKFRAERPGKIMHELRVGELARTASIPHTPYYGSVDATALWLMLQERYIRWTADIGFLEKQWPFIKQGLAWLDKASQHTGYLSYKRESSHGLENQGWKDSGDAICHSDGILAVPPISLCEVQGYLYAARLAAAELADLLGHKTLGSRLRLQSAKLKAKFLQDFWMEEEDFPALALDSKGMQVKVVSSNAGHCLWTGILDGTKAARVASRLLESDVDSGWGLRTLASTSVYFNPMSYHNGSVWPHDNAIIIEGLRRIGKVREAHHLISSIMGIATHQQDFRLPELVCGFERTHWAGPIEYPVSCSPQSWAAGSIFQMLSACLNLQPDAIGNTLRIVDPLLPDWLDKVTINNMRIGQSTLDLAFSKSVSGSTFCQVLRKDGDVRVIIET